MPSLKQSRGDVLVIGGGPAGLAAAIALRLQGLQVTVADSRLPPIDKACGEGILPAGLDALRKLGVPLSAADGFPFRGVRFIEQGVSADARFSSSFGIGLRRTRLHQLLTGRAAELGVQFRFGTTIPGVSSLSSFGWVVGADGQQSRVRRESDLQSGLSLCSRFGFRRHYRLAPWTDLVEIYWGKGFQLYVTPVSHHEIGVALLSRVSTLRLDDALCELPALSGRLGSAPLASTERGAATTTRWLRRVSRGRIVLVGDASGSVDAITGEGLSLAFLEAHALAEALAAGNVGIYQKEHRKLFRRPATMAGLLLLLDSLPLIRRSLWRGLAFYPAWMSRVLAGYTLPDGEAGDSPRCLNTVRSTR